MEQLHILSSAGIEQLLRWLHIVFGIAWIGILYYFNLVQTEYFKEAEAAAKNDALQKLVPRALWWFRWGAMFTFLSGIVLLLMISGRWNTYTLFAVLLGTLMWGNVWFRIWPMQKIVIADASGMTMDSGPPPSTALARAGVASRHNTLFSVPMAFFMVSSAHLGGGGLLLAATQDILLPAVLGSLLILALEVNAIIGKTGVITTIRGVISWGFVLTLVLYLLAELL